MSSQTRSTLPNGWFHRHHVAQWATNAFTNAGLSLADASEVSSSLVQAECRGVRSHGLILLPLYVERILGGGIRTNYQMRIVHDGGACVTTDGDGGPGQVLARDAMHLACSRAATHGMAYVCVRNGNHIGMLATYGLLAANAGYLGIVVTNSGPSVGVTGGKGKRIGNNAICIAAPSDSAPFVADMATGIVACGKIRLAEMDGGTVPYGWLLDANGNPSESPTDLDTGGWVPPMGDHKGYALAAAIDILTGLLAEGSPSITVRAQRNPTDTPTGTCQAFIAVDPQALGAMTFGSAVTAYVQQLRESPPIGGSKVLAPGDPELLAEAISQRQGFYLSSNLLATLNATGARLGMKPLSTESTDFQH